MWLLLAFASAFLLGFYDVAKKRSLRENAVLPVLFLNTVFSFLIILPVLVVARTSPMALRGTPFEMPEASLIAHGLIFVKAVLVLSSWVLGYLGMKHLPLTLVGPINATRPVMVLLGALLLFREQLNLFQWIGVLISIFSFFLLSRSGKREGFDFLRSPWALCTIGAAVLGASSGLYDKYLLAALRLPAVFVQVWNNVYQLLVMCPVLLLLWWPNRKEKAFSWRWSIPMISILICAADFCYFSSLSLPGAMISVVSMVRRSSVIVSFLYAAFVFREKNLRSKAVDLALMLLGMVFLCLGSIYG